MTAKVAHDTDLRRADWRFLLPWSSGKTFDHLLLLGGPDELAHRITEAGIARRLSRSLPVDVPVDAAIILDGSATPHVIERAAASVGTDGVLYCEVDRRSTASIGLSPRSIERRIRHQGLSVTGVYWPLPGFAPARRYVPLHTDGALTWYLSHLYGGGTAQQFLFDRAMRVVTGNRGTRFARLAPWFGLVATRGAGRLLSVLAHPDLPERLRQPELQPLLLTMGIDEGSRAVMLPFKPGQRQPEAVVKIARVENVNANIESEQRTLHDVRSLLDEKMRDTVPEPFGNFCFDGLTVGIEGCARGRSMFVSSGHFRTATAEKLNDLRLATEWITRFDQQAQLGSAATGTSLLAEQSRRVFVEYAAAFGASRAVDRLFDAVRARIDSLADTSLPIVWQHGDFGPWNISREGERVTVIDWETRQGPFADRSGPPLTDLIYFVTYWSFVARRIYGIDAERRAFRDIFVNPAGMDCYVDAIHQAVGSYLHQLKIDRRFVVPILVFTWVRRALESVERDRILQRSGTPSKEPNSFVEWIEILAAGQDQLFSSFEPVTHTGAVTVV